MRIRIGYCGQPATVAQACRVIEELCEGIVEAMRAEIELDPDAYPCCAGCAEFRGIDGPCTPAQTSPLAEIAERRDMSVDELVDATGGLEPAELGPELVDTIVVRCATAICARGAATTLEAACFQAAQRRRRGADPACRVVIVAAFDCDGSQVPGFRALVENSTAHTDPERRGTLDDVVAHQSSSSQVCSCQVAGGPE